ncbi:MAG: DUF445 family protein, partial [Symbiobacteriaceae bacterium]|nr:DUF445 family protein [Symbiobacteriaceae bacterium]
KYLINEEELHRVLLEQRIQEELAGFLAEGWQSLSTHNGSLGDLISALFEDPTHPSCELKYDELTNISATQVSLNKMKTWLWSVFHEVWDSFISIPENMQACRDLSGAIAEQLTEHLLTSDLTLRTLLADDQPITASLSVILANLEPIIFEMLATFLRSDSLKNEVSKKLSDWMQQQVILSLVASVAGDQRLDNLVARLLGDIASHVLISDNHLGFVDSLLTSLKDYENLSISEIITYCGADQLKHLLQTIITSFLEFSNSNPQQATYLLLPSEMEGNPAEFEQQLLSFVTGILSVARDIPLHALLGTTPLPDDLFPSLAAAILRIGADHAAALLEALDIATMVQRRLIEVPVAEIEAMTLEIAGRELGLITNLGALLGGIIGISQLLVRIF